MTKLAKIPNEAQFSQATIGDLSYISEKMLALHHFESADQPAALEVNANFKSQLTDWITIELNTPSSLIFLIWYEEHCIGFAFMKIMNNPNAFTLYKNYGCLQSLWIDQEYREHNFGKQTVCFVESIFREQNISYYDVNYTSSNETARRFWQSCGLEETAITARKFLD